MKQTAFKTGNRRNRRFRVNRSPEAAGAAHNVIAFAARANAPGRTGMDPAMAERLRGFFESECAEAGLVLAMSRRAAREGFPEVAKAYRRIAMEEAEHAARFAELLNEKLGADTKSDLTDRVQRENSAILGKLELARQAGTLGYDAVCDTARDIARDEARHGCAFMGLLREYF